jgi:hypothetical protein
MVRTASLGKLRCVGVAGPWLTEGKIVEISIVLFEAGAEYISRVDSKWSGGGESGGDVIVARPKEKGNKENKTA